VLDQQQRLQLALVSLADLVALVRRVTDQQELQVRPEQNCGGVEAACNTAAVVVVVRSTMAHSISTQLPEHLVVVTDVTQTPQQIPQVLLVLQIVVAAAVLVAQVMAVASMGVSGEPAR